MAVVSGDSPRCRILSYDKTGWWFISGDEDAVLWLTN